MCLQALAAAARFFDTGSGSSLLPSGTKPTSCTLSLLLAAAAKTSEPDLLMGTWRYFGDQWQQQQQGGGSSSRKSGAGSAADVLAPANVLHALVYGSVKCDLAAAAAASAGNGSSSSEYGFAAGAAAAAAASSTWQPVSSALFHADSATVEVLREIHAKVQQYHLQQQSRQRQQQQQQKGQPPLPIPLLHPSQASELLQYTCSTADVDVLLLSQLYQPRGLAVNDIIKLARRARTQQQQQQHDLTATDQAVQYSGADVVMSNHLLTVLPDLKLVDVPQFPPRLRSDVARSAVQAYLRHGAVQRAAAVAHAAAVANPRDLQQYHLLVRGCAAAGQLLPALTVVENVRHHLWQTVSPTAQADMLR